MFARLLAAGLIALAAPYAAAQQYPSKPVRIIVPFAPGGGSDFTARLMAQKLTERYGQSFIVENRAGAGGNLGAALALKAPPDGYTLLLISASYTVNPSVYKLSFDPIKDIAPVIQISGGPYVVAVHPSVPAKTLAEFVTSYSGYPDSAMVGSSGAAAMRFCVVTARPRSLPALTCGSVVGTAPKMSCTWPPSVS